jgi:pimeloyl-ACP methyl ester carboxylesterase
MGYPELVSKLVIAIAGYRREGEGRRIVEGWCALAKEKRLRALMRSMYRSAARGRLARLVASLIGYLAGPLLGCRLRDLGDFVVTLEALLAHDGWNLLSEIEAPTLIIGGDQDVVYPREILEAIHQRIPDSLLALYRGVGHGVLEFRKKEFDRDVLAFLAK